MGNYTTLQKPNSILWYDCTISVVNLIALDLINTSCLAARCCEALQSSSIFLFKSLHTEFQAQLFYFVCYSTFLIRIRFDSLLVPLSVLDVGTGSLQDISRSTITITKSKKYKTMWFCLFAILSIILYYII